MKPVIIIPINKDMFKINSMLVASFWVSLATSLSHSPAHKPCIANAVPPEMPPRGALPQTS